MQIRIVDLVGDTRVGIVLAVAITSLMFGIAHIEQEIIGVVVACLDGVLFNLVKLRYDGNLWASVLARGTSNTLGMLALLLLGPIHGSGQELQSPCRVTNLDVRTLPTPL